MRFDKLTTKFQQAINDAQSLALGADNTAVSYTHLDVYKRQSSLGCTAMAWYADQADVVDLDGPWLIKNDPFKGMIMRNGNVVLPEGPGFGVVLTAELDWTPIGA